MHCQQRLGCDLHKKAKRSSVSSNVVCLIQHFLPLAGKCTTTAQSNSQPWLRAKVIAKARTIGNTLIFVTGWTSHWTRIPIGWLEAYLKASKKWQPYPPYTTPPVPPLVGWLRISLISTGNNSRIMLSVCRRRMILDTTPSFSWN